MARMELSMQAPPSANSSTCIAAQQCIPLGGYSVTAAVPPMAPPSNDTAAAATAAPPAILVLAGVDSSGLFHNLIQAADAPLSGLIAMLAAAEALGGTTISEELYRRRIVFAAMMGEPWGLMGSRRMLWEMYNGSTAVAGLSIDAIEGIIEMGQVGKAVGQSGAVQLYTHTDDTPEAAARAKPLESALQAAAAVTAESQGVAVAVTAADSAAQGMPPSSTEAFLRVRDTIPAVVLTEFDAEFINGEFHSQYDTAEGIDAQGIAAVASVLARSLHALALNGSAGNPAAPALVVNETRIQLRVGELIDCLVKDDPGMACTLASRIMTPVNPGPTPHYIGILRTVTAGEKPMMHLF